jgi:ATP-binding cassette subfamily C (CFTR/MRP) protein 4
MLIMRHRFARGYCDIKRLEGTTRSPIYSYLSSTIHGLKVIRSYHAEKMCSQQFLSHLDDHIRVYFSILVTERWAAIRFDWVTLTFLCLVTLFSMLVRIYHQQFSTVDIALTLAYSLNLLGLFQWTIRFDRKKKERLIEFYCFYFQIFRQSVAVESQMTSVERVLEYCSLDQEPPAQVSPKNRPPMNWPSQGEIVFKNVSMAYLNEEYPSLVLRNITLQVKGGEKIGIVGRTGAGKSSLIQILFRMGILVNGQIEIDDIDIDKIGLDDLRSRISIIPQDPVLFTGTIRNNLNPFNFYSDHQIWSALEEVCFKKFFFFFVFIV